MFDFLTGFLLGIAFTCGALLFAIYKLLMRLNENHASPHAHHLQYNPLKTVNHSISKHSFDDSEVNIESCDWLNTLAAVACVEALSSPLLIEGLHKKLHDILNNPADKPDVLGNIVISDINMGNGLPLVDGVRVLSRSNDDSLHAEVGIRYNGGASFTISTELWMNWPSPKFAALPVSLHASFDNFAGTLTASCYRQSMNSMRCLVFFRAPPVFQLRIGSTIGHSTKLVNVLQVSTLLENMIYSFVNKELVFPNGFEIDIEDSKVVCVRKLASVRTITEKGERTQSPPPQNATPPPATIQNAPPPPPQNTTTQRPNKGERNAHTGDLTHRGFTVTTH